MLKNKYLSLRKDGNAWITISLITYFFSYVLIKKDILRYLFTRRVRLIWNRQQLYAFHTEFYRFCFFLITYDWQYWFLKIFSSVFDIVYIYLEIFNNGCENACIFTDSAYRTNLFDTRQVRSIDYTYIISKCLSKIQSNYWFLSEISSTIKLISIENSKAEICLIYLDFESVESSTTDSYWTQILLSDRFIENYSSDKI